MVVLRAEIADSGGSDIREPHLAEDVGAFGGGGSDETAPTPAVTMEDVMADAGPAQPAPPPATRVGQPPAPAPVAIDGTVHLYDLADEVASVLRAAHLAAHELRQRAEADAGVVAAQLLSQARSEAAAIRAEADRLRRQSTAETAAVRADAEQLRRTVEAEAEVRRRTLDAEAATLKAAFDKEEQERQVLLRELDDLRAQRDDALDSYVVLRRTLRAVDVAVEKWHKDEPPGNWRHARR